MKKLFPYLLLLLAFTAAHAQETYTISGTVSDTKGGTLPGATVFLTNTKHITGSDNNGKFSIKGLEAGTYELVIKMIGFTAYVNKVTVGDKPVVVNAVLKDDNVLLKVVTIKVADPNRDKYIKTFTKYFIGESTNASQCKILNPEVLNFHYDKNTDILEASTERVLQIENKGLGYQLNYLVTDFKFDQKNLTLSYTGYPYFEELKGSEAQQKRWESSRRAAYAGSMTHFFKSVFNHTAEKEGFVVYPLTDKIVRMNLVPSAPAASNEKASIRAQGGTISGTIPGKAEVTAIRPFLSMPADSFFKQVDKNTKILIADYNKRTADDTTAFFVFYRGGSEPYSYVKSGLYVQSPVKLPGRGQLSKLEPLTSNIMIDMNGRVNPEQGFLVSGYWGWEKIAELVPSDYRLEEPESSPLTTAIAAKMNETVNRFNNYTAARPAENIYLHLNKPWYARADTIWFRAYTVKGSHQLTDISKVAYAELVNPADSVIQKVNLKLEAGMASGEFDLPLNLTPGNYRVRAYTNWMKNAGEETYDDRAVIIGNPASAPAPAIAANVAKKANAPVAPRASANAAADIADVQFFPEGGDLVNGLRGVVAFKAVNPDGTGAQVKGSITTTTGEAVADLEDGHNGMGLFAFTPQDGKSYSAKLQFANGNTETVNLLKAIAEGYSLTVNNRLNDTLLIKIAASPNLLKNKAGKGFYLVAQSGGKVYYTTTGTLTNQAYSINITKDRFPTGVLRITLFSETGEPLNERVAFIRQPDNLQVKLTAAKTVYAANEKVDIGINALSAMGQPVTGSFSAAVINESKVPVDEATEPTILSQLLLSNELRGRISDPGHYFADQTEKTNADLDLLMLTQGYRKLEWKKLLDTTRQTPKYAAEDGLSITGIVKNPDGKPAARAKVTAVFPTKHISVDTLTDNFGRFMIPNLDVSENTKVVVQAISATNSKNVHIILDQPEQRAARLPVYTVKTSPQLSAAYLDEERQYLLAKGKLLKEVTVKEKYDPNKNKPDLSTSANLNGPGQADQVVMGKDLDGCPILSTCLIGKIKAVNITADGKIIDISRGGKFNWQQSQQTNSTGSIPMMVSLNGFIISSVDDVNPDDIYSIEVLTSTKYKAIYGHDAAGGLILITTKKGVPANERLATEKAPNIVNYIFNGYYKDRVFYSPKYDGPPDAGAEQRSAIYWKPDLVTGKDGKANLEYSNAGKGNYRVVVEGIDSDGRLGRAVYKYVVE
jgi:hypothetical protein